MTLFISLRSEDVVEVDPAKKLWEEVLLIRYVLCQDGI
jgi:hypothetical protein